MGLCDPAVFGGVRRGVSFRTPAGPRFAQIATMLWLFMLGLTALAALPGPALPGIITPILLIIGYLSVAILDPIAARRGEAPCSSPGCVPCRWQYPS